MILAFAWSTVRTNRAGLASSFVAVLMAVMLVAGSGLLVAGAGADEELEGVIGLLVLSALVSGFVSVFVVASMLSMHVLGQRRAWALVRSIGMSPRQVRRLVMAEALVVAALAAAAGCLLAVPYAAAMATFMRGVGLAPAGIPLRMTPVPFVLALIVGVSVTLLAARGAASRAVRVGPLEVLRDSAMQRRLLSRSRMVVATVALAGGAVLLWLVPRVKADSAVPTGLAAMMVLCVAASALGPVLLRGLGGLLGAPVTWLDPGAGMLARSALVTQPRRAMSAASPVMVTVALACTFLFAIATSDAAAGVTRSGPSAWAAPLLVGSAVVYTVISVLNATAMSMAERAGEIRLLRSVGMKPRQLTRAVCWESLIVTCAGVLLGAVIAACSLAALGVAATGRPWLAYSLPQFLAVALICLVSSLMGGLGATREARRGALLDG